MNETITVTLATDVLANLDINDGQPTAEASIDGDGTDTEYQQNNEYLGVQQEFVKMIQMRLKEEVNMNKNSTNQLVMEHLKINSWWIQKEHEHHFVKWLV